MENLEIIKIPDEVNSRIRELGSELSTAYGQAPLTMGVVMNGGLFFAAKSAEAIHIDSIAAGSYTQNAGITGVSSRS